LILHQQLLTNRAQRALIVVPPSLLHQWLVERLRRFNLSFTLLDEARCRSLEGRDSGDEDAQELPDGLGVSGLDELNPLESVQCVLCSLESLTRQLERQQQVNDAGWDLLLVDEADHSLWSAEQASDEYQAIEALAATGRGLLLLTA